MALFLLVPMTWPLTVFRPGVMPSLMMRFKSLSMNSIFWWTVHSVTASLVIWDPSSEPSTSTNWLRGIWPHSSIHNSFIDTESHSTRFTNSSGDAAPIYLEFGHDTTIDLALTGLGLVKDTPSLRSSVKGPVRKSRTWRTSSQVPFAAQMVWEKFTCSSSYVSLVNSTRSDLTHIRYTGSQALKSVCFSMTRLSLLRTARRWTRNLELARWTISSHLALLLPSWSGEMLAGTQLAVLRHSKTFDGDMI